MSNVTPQLVKALRDKTGAGMAECKKALDESQGDMEAAIEFLRKRGAASAAKRADRSANEGVVIALTKDEGRTAVIVEVNCETDFVARNEEFGAYAQQIAQAYLDSNIASEDELWATEVAGKKLGDTHNEILSKFSEKIGVGRVRRHALESGYVADYVHAGSRLAVLLVTNASAMNEKGRALLRDVAMQVAAMNPMFVDRDSVDATSIQKEIEIYRDQAIQEGKKPEIAERIATGRLEKFYQEQCLVEQAFVKDSSKTVTEVLKEVSADVGAPVKILSFDRFMLGELN